MGKRFENKPRIGAANKTAHSQAIRNFNDRFDFEKDNYRVSVYRVLPGGKLKYLGNHIADEVDHHFVRETYGAGKYTLKLIDSAGKWRAQATVNIGVTNLEFRGNFENS